jgi:hypothetical protein
MAAAQREGRQKRNQKDDVGVGVADDDDWTFDAGD